MPTTTNLGLTYPASTGYVSNGAADMGTLATGLDAFYGSMTTYTPATTGITSATVSGRYVRMGKLGFVFLTVTAGTASAGTPTLGLPTGWTSARVQPMPALRGSIVAACYANSAVATISLLKDAAGTVFTLGDAVSTYRVSAWIELT